MDTSVKLCRVRADGKYSLVMTVDHAIVEALGLVAKDVIGFRLITVQGRIMLIGEKVALHKIALLTKLPSDVLPSER